VAPEPRGIKVLIGPVVSEQRLFVRADPVYEIKKKFLYGLSLLPDLFCLDLDYMLVVNSVYLLVIKIAPYFRIRYCSFFFFFEIPVLTVKICRIADIHILHCCAL